MERTKEQLKLLVDCAPETTVIYLAGDETDALVPFLYSADTPAFFGLTEQEYLDSYRDNAEKIVLPQDLPILLEAIKRLDKIGRAETCTYRTYHKTMGTVWTHAALKWIGEFEGRRVLVGVYTDVSNQVAENTPGGFFVYAAQEDDQFFFIGENMLKMLGYSREEFQEKFHNRFRYMVCEEDRDATLKSIDDQIADNGRYDKVDYRIEKKDGSFIWVHDEGHYVVDKDNRPWFYVTINDMSDIFEENSKLHRENTKLDAIINSIPVGIYVYRVDGPQSTLVAVNEAVQKIYDATPGQMAEEYRSLFSQRVHPEDYPALNSTMQAVRTIGSHKSPPFRFFAEDGTWKWLRIEAQTVAMADGTLLVYNVLMDLTAEKQAEEKLAKTHRVQQELYKSSMEALLFANPQSLCTVRLNLSQNKCAEWYGTSQFVIDTIRSETAEGVIDNISNIIINEADRKKFRQHFDCAALLDAFQKGKKSDSLRYRRTIEDGSSLWVETVVNMVENPDTHAIEAVLFSENVNDQVLNEEIIQKSSDAGYDYIATLHVPNQLFQFRYLGNGIPSVFKTRYSDLRRSRPLAEILAYAVQSWVAPDEKAHFLDEFILANMIAHLNQEESYTVTVKSRRLDASEGWKQIRITWLDEMKDRILIQQVDVSEAVQLQQKELLERLNTERTLRNEADKANESKSNFISNVSHDMRTPLNAILGYDRLALETDSAEMRTDYLEKIGAAGKTLLSLINDTLDLQKIENGVTTLHLAPVPCSVVVNGILTAVKPLMEAKKIQFTFDNSKAVMATIYADATRVQEIFINLVSNAVKFTPEGGKVLFSVTCVKETEDTIYDKLVVEDSGVGISKDFLPKIFEPFAQERNEATAGIGGSGLGLSIVKRLIDLMDGCIEVESEPGKGSTFTVYLTFKKADDLPDGTAAAPAQDHDALEGKTILMCEDNWMNREIAKALLEKNGISIVSAVNGEEGVRCFTQSPPGTFAAVLMDIRMPIMDGYEASKAIRASGHPDAKRIPIIALSADAYVGDIQKAHECGMNCHLSKPIDPGQLFRVLADAVASPADHEE
jgi:PAS domain S-box-containing protein